MDTLLAMQKIFGLRALVRDSPLTSSSEIFAKPTKEPQSAAQLSFVEETRRDIRVHSSWGSLTESTHSTLVEPLPKATIPLRKSLLRSMSELPSSRHRMLPQRAKSAHPAEKVTTQSRTRQERTISMFGMEESGGTRREKTLWSDNDQYLPPAKPSPPLKHVKHRPSEHNTLADRTISTQPFPSNRGPSERSSTSDSRPTLLPRRSSDGSILRALSKERDQLVPDVPRLSKRRSAREARSFTEEPCDNDWQPPSDWVGPSKAAPADASNKSTLIGWFTRKKSLGGSKAASMRMAARLNHVRSPKKSESFQVTVTGAPKEEEDYVPQGGSFVMVKTQCFEGYRWDEKPVADIIPELRQLKLK